jgi:ligand-binding sensor domain-containing protein
LALSAKGVQEQTGLAGHKISKFHAPLNVNDSSPFIKVIFEDKEGKYWLGTGIGLFFYDENTNTWEAITSSSGKLVQNQVSMMGQSSDGRLWFASTPIMAFFGFGISCFDGKHWSKVDGTNSPLKYFEEGNESSPVYSIFQGRNGALWFSLEDSLVAYDQGKWRSRLKTSLALNEPVDITITVGIQDRKGYMWLASSIKGIIGYDENKQEWKSYDPLQNKLKLNEKALDKNSQEVINVISIYEDRKGYIWFGTREGKAYVFNKEMNTWKSFDLTKHLPLSDQNPKSKGNELHLYINSIYQDSDSKMMFATNQGLLTYTENNSLWQFYNSQNSPLPCDQVFTIIEDKHNRIWIGTKGVLLLEQ